MKLVYICPFSVFHVERRSFRLPISKPAIFYFLIAMPCLCTYIFYTYDMFADIILTRNCNYYYCLNCFMCSYAFALIEYDMIHDLSFAVCVRGICYLGWDGFLLVFDSVERTIS